MTIQVRSNSFKAGEPLPPRFTCDGEGASPHLAWSGAPDETKSFVIFCEDPDAPNGKFYHWGLYNVPAKTEAIDEDADEASFEAAKTSRGEAGWLGACPPPGDAPHNYHFHVWALDVGQLEFDHPPSVEELQAAARGHIVDRGEIKAWYGR